MEDTANVINFPGHLLAHSPAVHADLQIVKYEVCKTAAKNKINLTKNVLSFLLEGQKDIHFSNDCVSINETQSLLISSSNFLLTETVTGNRLRCLLFFFAQKNIDDFLLKHGHAFNHNSLDKKLPADPYFLVQKDNFIVHFINSLQNSFDLQDTIAQKILELKFEEIMLYLANKYGERFFIYLNSLLVNERELSFKIVVEKNQYSNLNMEEIAFLCNMSVSTFKRKFTTLYQASPGKWFQQKRLIRAKELLLTSAVTPSEIFMDFGYDSLSSFSAAFKNEFGYSPKYAQST